MKKKLIALTRKLISMNSVSVNSNFEIIEYCKTLLQESGYTTEYIKYNNGEDKFNLIAQKGSKPGGLAFVIHIDTVPLASETQLNPEIIDNKIYGRGACDMKGPAAAALLAGIENISDKTITYIITSDEEIGCVGAKHVVEESRLLKENTPDFALVTEPTELIPIHAHKGLADIAVTATGSAAHSSLDIGDNANFKLAPFLADVAHLKKKYLTDSAYFNNSFSPKTNGLNMVISDNDCALNITAPFSRALISYRTMPKCKSREVIDEIKEAAEKHGLLVVSNYIEPIYIDPEHNFVKKAENITGKKAETVPYLTDAFRFKELFTPIILGPGSINQAHTKDEYIDIDELIKGYEIYTQFILK